MGWLRSLLGRNSAMVESSGKQKLDQFATDLGRSGLVVSIDETLRAFHDRQLPNEKVSVEITALGAWLMGRRSLTYWQYIMLCEGKWKGFFLDGHRLLAHLSGNPGDGYYLAERVATGVRVVIRVPPPQPGHTGDPIYETVLELL